MRDTVNELGQAIGRPVPDWSARERPSLADMVGRHCSLVKLEANLHTDELHRAFARNEDGSLWTYLPFGPFASRDKLREWIETISGCNDPVYYAVIDRQSGSAVGVASFMRIRPEQGTIEVGGIVFSPSLQRTAMSTEAMFMMMRHAFEDLGYRRYEWKCDALNAPSRRAAQRLGFHYEGTFRNAMVYKGRNRDTAWYAVVAEDWPALRPAFEQWLDPENFAADGGQIASLASFTRRERPTTTSKGPVMTSDTLLLGFVLASLVVLILPGPGVVYVVTRSATQGYRAGMTSVLGLAAGALVHVAATVAGLSAVLLASATLFGLVKALGAAYLIYLGVSTLLGAKSSAKETAPMPAALPRIFTDGVLVSVLNPKIAVFFLAYLPQFVDPAGPSVTLQILSLGLIYVVLSVITDGGYALLAGGLREWLSKRVLKSAWPRYVSGTIYLGLGINTAITGRRDL